MDVEIFSDVVCPWCYLARARFGGAVARFGGAVNVTWRPFQLDPGASGGGLTDESLVRRFGGADRVAQMHDRMRELMAAEGLPYEPERAVQANTRAAHRLIAFAEEAGVQDAVIGRLFEAYHAEGRDLNDHETLASLATEAGLDRVRERLDAGEGDPEVTARLEAAQAIGVTGVPFFVFDGRWAVSGAQSAVAFENVLHDVAARA